MEPLLATASIRRPIVFNYEDFRFFLKESFYYLKTTSAFSYRKFNLEAGFTSPNYLKRVIDGDRNLSSSSIPKCAKALRLNQQENWFFENLVFFNQSKSVEE